MKNWAGTVLLGIGGIVVSAWAIPSRPWWFTAAIVFVCLVVPVLLWPVKKFAPTATIRGNVTNSKIVNVTSDADLLIDGNVKESLVKHIVHRPRR